MMVTEMSEKECREVLMRASLGRLACSLDGQPYIVPVYFAYEADYVYVLSTLGQKIEWMRANPKVCLEVEEIKSQSQWMTLVATGLYQELPEPQYADEREHARELLEKHHHWWLNAMAERQLKSADHLIAPIFFRIHLDSMTGLRAQPGD
ncbi:MAG TPA: pyridoxamine 5'-phosphate oxidase family protein [Terriglobales bacterium]|nr:pyridoxamine 5'-phosphate oxidase family protein [Terriglobales bacterium]